MTTHVHIAGQPNDATQDAVDRAIRSAAEGEWMVLTVEIRNDAPAQPQVCARRAD